MRPPLKPSITLAAALLTGGAAAFGLSRTPAPPGTTLPDGPTVFAARGDAPAPSPARPLVLLPAPEVRAPTPDLLHAVQALASGAQQLPQQYPQEDYFKLRDPEQDNPWEMAHAFYFTRGVYPGGGFGRFGFRSRGMSWATDVPDAEYHLTTVMPRLTNIDLWYGLNHVRLDDPNLRRYPFVYILEVGSMNLSSEMAEGLRSYLDAGGFLMVDDFWGSWEWANWFEEIQKVFPERPPEELMVELHPGEHDLFNQVYNIEEVVQVPGIGGGRGRPTYQGDGVVPHVFGIFDDAGRLMVVVNWNTDLGDAWEHADSPRYPLESSTYAFEVAVNQIVYAMSH